MEIHFQNGEKARSWPPRFPVSVLATIACPRRRSAVWAGLALAAMLSATALSAPAQQPASPYAKWEHGLPKSADFFPVAVWLQQPRNAGRFQELGFNLLTSW